MPPPRTSPFRKITDWSFDPWGTPEQRKAWDAERKRRWIASLSERDWARIGAMVDQVADNYAPAALDDLDAPIRVGACDLKEVGRYSGVKFGTLKGRALLAWAKE